MLLPINIYFVSELCMEGTQQVKSRKFWSGIIPAYMVKSKVLTKDDELLEICITHKYAPLGFYHLW